MSLDPTTSNLGNKSETGITISAHLDVRTLASLHLMYVEKKIPIASRSQLVAFALEDFFLALQKNGVASHFFETSEAVGYLRTVFGAEVLTSNRNRRELVNSLRIEVESTTSDFEEPNDSPSLIELAMREGIKE